MTELHILQVTDCHLFADPDATLLGVPVRDSLRAVLDSACAERRPDALLATGDIAQRPEPATYRLFLETVREHYDGPLLCVPGNHDLGAPFAATLPTEGLALGGWRLLGVDTHVDDMAGGSVTPAELERLAGALAGPGPTLVAGHHCPVATGCRWLDEHRIDNGDALMEVLRRGGARAYAFGHIHQPFDQRPAGGLPTYGTPSTCFQFASNAPTFALDDAKPGCRWFALGADGGVRTRVARAEAFPLRIDPSDKDRP